MRIVLRPKNIINAQLEADQDPLTDAEIKKYYREDRIIWSLYLTFRRVDRWLTTKIWGRRYEYATIIGYGEISAIFQIGDNFEVAFKRLPLFADRPSAEKYH